MRRRLPLASAGGALLGAVFVWVAGSADAEPAPAQPQVQIVSLDGPYSR
jgi:hypothetical protein